jgi:hypothetical protein
MPTCLPLRAAARRRSVLAPAIFAALPLAALVIALIFDANVGAFAWASPF